MAGRSDIKAGSAYIELYVKNSALVKGLKAAQKSLEGFGTKIMGIGSAFAGLGGAILAPLGAAVAHFVTAGSALNDMSARTGVAAGALAELKFAAEQNGASFEDVETGIKKMQKAVAEAGKDGPTHIKKLGKGAIEVEEGVAGARKKLDDLGISLEALKGKKPDEQFQMFADAVTAIEDPGARAAAAMSVFGKTGTKLIPMLETLRETRKEAREAGLIPTEEAVSAADAMGDAFDKLKAIGLAAAFSIGAALAPAIMPVARIVTNIAVAVNKWVQKNGELFRIVAAVGAGLLVAGAVITGLGAVIFGVGAAFGVLATVITTLGTIAGYLLSPIGLIAAALVAGVVIWARYTQSGQAATGAVMRALGELLAFAKKVFGGIFDALSAGDFSLAGQIAVKALQVAFAIGVSKIIGLFQGPVADAIGTIGTQLLSGDFSGAWDTVVTSMGALWASFAQGVVNTFTEVGRKVTEIWQGTVNGLTDYLLKKSSEGGAFGKLMSRILGVDMQEEIERAKRMDEQGKKFGNKPQADNMLSDAQQMARDQTAQTAEKLKGFFDTMDQVAADNKKLAEDKLKKKTAGGAAGFEDKSAELKKELDALVAAAAEAKKKADEKRDEKKPAVDALEDKASQTKASVFASSFAAGSGSSVAGDNPAKQTVAELKAIRAAQAKQHKEDMQMYRDFLKVRPAFGP